MKRSMIASLATFAFALALAPAFAHAAEVQLAGKWTQDGCQENPEGGTETTVVEITASQFLETSKHYASPDCSGDVVKTTTEALNYVVVSSDAEKGVKAIKIVQEAKQEGDPKDMTAEFRAPTATTLSAKFVSVTIKGAEGEPDMVFSGDDLNDLPVVNYTKL